MMMDPQPQALQKPWMLTGSQLVEAYRKHSLTPTQVISAIYQQINLHHDNYYAFCYIDEATALEAAVLSTQRYQSGAPVGALDGVPVTVKDVCNVQGWPTIRGSLIYKSLPTDQVVAKQDSPVVEALRGQNAILLGKTTTPEFAWKGVTDDFHNATRNPWHRDYTSGGSSGGAATAAAFGWGVLHLGSDGAGSIRIPSAFSGVLGFKPTFGRVPVYPPSLFTSITHYGPIARSVADVALMLDVMANADPRDANVLPKSERPFLEVVKQAMGSADEAPFLKNRKIAYAPRLSHGSRKVDRQVKEKVEAAVQCFRDLGAQVDVIDPLFDDPIEAIRGFWSVSCARILSSIPQSKHFLIEKSLLEDVIFPGTQISLPQYFQFEEVRDHLGVIMNRFHQTYDLLLTATLPIPAFKVYRGSPESAKASTWMQWCAHTYPFNLTRQPALSFPVGNTDTDPKLPVAIQIVGPRFRDDWVLAAAAQLETLVPIHFPKP